MHLHSVTWFACLVWLIALLYQCLIGIPFVAGLAVLLYALDDAHGAPVAFLANRNAVVAATFGVLSVWLHDRWRRNGWSPGAMLSPLAFLAALLGGESGAATGLVCGRDARPLGRQLPHRPVVECHPNAVLRVSSSLSEGLP